MCGWQMVSDGHKLRKRRFLASSLSIWGLLRGLIINLMPLPGQDLIRLMDLVLKYLLLSNMQSADSLLYFVKEHQRKQKRVFEIQGRITLENKC